MLLPHGTGLPDVRDSEGEWGTSPRQSKGWCQAEVAQHPNCWGSSKMKEESCVSPNTMGRWCYIHFTNWENKSKKGHMPCPRFHIYWFDGTGFWTPVSDPQTLHLALSPLSLCFVYFILFGGGEGVDYYWLIYSKWGVKEEHKPNLPEDTDFPFFRWYYIITSLQI